jgi:WD40 repeat protein
MHMRCYGPGFIASCSADMTVRVWKSYKPGNNEGISVPDQEVVWKCVCTISGYHHRPIYSIDWSPCSGLIATGCGDDAIRIFQEDTIDSCQTNFKLIWQEDKAHSTDVNCVAWHPIESTLLASCSDDRTIKLWRLIQ